MPAAKKTAVKAVRPRAARPAPVDDVPEELRGFYDDDPTPAPPRLRRARGAGTTGGGYQPLELSTKTPRKGRDVELEPLFYLDGEEYGIPAEFPPSLALVYLDAIDEGRDVAAGRVLKMAIGRDGWTALMRYVTAGGAIGMRDMAAMLNHVMVKVMGTVEGMGEGNS
jgi:hypothetical protein